MQPGDMGLRIRWTTRMQIWLKLIILGESNHLIRDQLSDRFWTTTSRLVREHPFWVWLAWMIKHWTTLLTQTKLHWTTRDRVRSKHTGLTLIHLRTMDRWLWNTLKTSMWKSLLISTHLILSKSKRKHSNNTIRGPYQIAIISTLVLRLLKCSLILVLAIKPPMVRIQTDSSKT
jgi:hypothetical protein